MRASKSADKSANQSGSQSGGSPDNTARKRGRPRGGSNSSGGSNAAIYQKPGKRQKVDDAAAKKVRDRSDERQARIKKEFNELAIRKFENNPVSKDELKLFRDGLLKDFTEFNELKPEELRQSWKNFRCAKNRKHRSDLAE